VALEMLVPGLSISTGRLACILSRVGATDSNSGVSQIAQLLPIRTCTDSDLVQHLVEEDQITSSRVKLQGMQRFNVGEYLSTSEFTRWAV
jgi:hypothetical protein